MGVLDFSATYNYREPPKSLEGTRRTEHCGWGCGLENQGQRILARLGFTRSRLPIPARNPYRSSVVQPELLPQTRTPASGRCRAGRIQFPWTHPLRVPRRRTLPRTRRPSTRITVPRLHIPCTPACSSCRILAPRLSHFGLGLPRDAARPSSPRTPISEPILRSIAC